MKSILNLRNLFARLKADPREERQKKTRRSKNGQRHAFGGCRDRKTSSIFTSRHGKLKGYMKETRRTDRGHGYNKHRIHASR